MSKIIIYFKSKINMSKVKVVTIGLGYIGLPTSALIAKNGIKVHGVDVNQQIVDTINQGKIHIIEPSLDIAVEEAFKSKRLFKSRFETC